MIELFRHQKLLLIFCFLMGYNLAPAKTILLTINFRTESKVIGPNIKLGEIGQIMVTDQKVKQQLNNLVIAKAAPPGEALEITRSYIKKCIREHGFNLNSIIFNGPKTIRITTIQNRLIHLRIDDPMA